MLEVELFSEVAEVLSLEWRTVISFHDLWNPVLSEHLIKSRKDESMTGRFNEFEYRKTGVVIDDDQYFAAVVECVEICT